MKNTLTGLLFVVFGLFFNYFSFDYSVGTSSNMGPGFYPYYLSWFLIVVGSAITVKGVIWKS